MKQQPAPYPFLDSLGLADWAEAVAGGLLLAWIVLLALGVKL